MKSEKMTCLEYPKMQIKRFFSFGFWLSGRGLGNRGSTWLGQNHKFFQKSCLRAPLRMAWLLNFPAKVSDQLYNKKSNTFPK